MTAFLRIAGFLTLAAVLLGLWTGSPANAIQSLSAQTPIGETARPGTGDGETPLPAGERENALKKRRAPLAQVVRVDDGGLARVTLPAIHRLADDSGLQRLDTTGRQANQRLALADKPASDDPAVRLPPGHAPPRQVHTSA